MGISFNITQHSVFPNVSIVEILIDNEVCGVIYPAGEKKIKVVSAHIVDSKTDEEFAGEVINVTGKDGEPKIPAFTIRFAPTPFIIRGNKVIKLKGG